MTQVLFLHTRSYYVYISQLEFDSLVRHYFKLQFSSVGQTKPLHYAKKKLHHTGDHYLEKIRCTNLSGILLAPQNPHEPITHFTAPAYSDRYNHNWHRWEVHAASFNSCPWRHPLTSSSSRRGLITVSSMSANLDESIK